MVRIVLLNLLRSKYGVEADTVEAETVESALERFFIRHPEMQRKDFDDAVLLVNGVRLDRVNRFQTRLQDGDEIVFTHFVGGG